MSHIYQDKSNAEKYLDFLNSENGQIQQEVLFDAIIKRLPEDNTSQMLDAACGPGWLTKRLAKDFPNVQGCDVSERLVDFAKKNYPGVNFAVTDLEQALPYPDNFFDAVILNMAAPDLESLDNAFRNLSAKLKIGGQFIMTIPNPEYTYPTAVWKRGVWGWLTGQKPKLKIKKLPAGINIRREFGRSQSIASHFYTLNEYLTAAKNAGLILADTQELKSGGDDGRFNLRYQLHRYPLLLLLDFKKLR